MELRISPPKDPSLHSADVEGFQLQIFLDSHLRAFAAEAGVFGTINGEVEIGITGSARVLPTRQGWQNRLAPLYRSP